MTTTHELAALQLEIDRLRLEREVAAAPEVLGGLGERLDGAHVVASALDRSGLDGLLGTVAGDDTMIGPNVSLITSEHPVAPSQRHFLHMQPPGREARLGSQTEFSLRRLGQPGLQAGNGRGPPFSQGRDRGP